MEPANLNPPADEEARLAAMLRAHVLPTADEEFSAKVLATLPLPQSSKQTWRLATVCTVGAFAGLLLAWHLGASWTAVNNIGGNEIAAYAKFLTEPWLCLALSLTGVSLLIPYLLMRDYRRVSF